MHVAQLWTYPVKSMVGGMVDAVEVNELGIVGDRTWALWEVERDILANCRQTPGIMQFRAAPDADGHATITAPDGTVVRTSDPDAAARLSDAIGREVRLESLRPKDDLEYYRSKGAPPEDLIGYLRDIFGRVEDEPLPDFGKFGQYAGAYVSPPGTFYDCFPLMVMSTSALRSMQEALPGSVIDVRRFRPSLVVDTGDEPGHPEFGWAGRRFRIGTAEIEVVNDCPRCASLTKEVAPDVPADRAILRHVVKDLDQAVGVYCNVVVPGTITTGDELLAI